MIAGRVIDVLLVLLLLVYLGEGWRNGFARSLAAILGIVAGGVLAFFAIPLVAALLPDPLLRIVATVVAALALLIGGHAAGAAVGRAIRGRGRDGRLGVVSRLLGGLANVVVAALVIALIAGGVGSLGMPFLTRAIADSVVLRSIDALTPEPVDAALARVRAAVLERGLPEIGEALGGVQDSPGAPDLGTGSDALDAAAASVLRIGGTAYACGQNQSGTGFVVAPDRVVTNAHVVAGVAEPVVESPGGQVLDGSVVYFDPVDDLAVIAVDGLDAPPLDLAEPLGVGEQGAIEGYPYGGPFTAGAARVLAVSTERIDDIYGTSRNPREVYSLAAVVRPGNSGGPLLDEAGDVAGVVFARSAVDDELGYAMTNTELAPVAAAAAALSAPVEPGACVPG